VKVLEVPFTYYPDSVGGTEVYVEALVRHLKDMGVRPIVAAPGNERTTYTHDGVSIHRYPTSECETAADLYGAGDEQAAEAFGAILDEQGPDVVHLHARTRGVSLRIAETAKERGLPVLLTYHTPTVSCMRGTLLYNGEEVCDGVMRRKRCASCLLHSHGVPEWLAAIASQIPTSVGEAASQVGRDGGVWTAASTPHFVNRQHQAIRSLFDTVDHVVAVCEWVRDVLTRNNVAPSKITVSRQGLPQDEASASPGTTAEVERSAASPRDSFDDANPLRLIFLGRIHPVKGVHVVVDALRRLPDAPIELDVYGITQNGSDYVSSLQETIESDARITWQDPIPSREVPERIREHDALVVPSQWLETGPLVVYESFAAGRPVVGSDLGGIAELVTDGVDGLLVSPDNPQAWTRVLSRLASNASLLSELTEGVSPPRTMRDAATEMLEQYQKILRADER